MSVMGKILIVLLSSFYFSSVNSESLVDKQFTVYDTSGFFTGKPPQSLLVSNVKVGDCNALTEKYKDEDQPVQLLKIIDYPNLKLTRCAIT